MPSSIALLLWFIFLLVLFFYDPARSSGTSIALWVPVIWMFIVGTRLPSQWLGGQVDQAAQALEEGNPLDRTISSALILIAIGVLVTRHFKWNLFFVRNLALSVFLLFALVSTLWSDFPLISLKRWFKDLGSYLVLLVVLSDPCPLEAIRTVLRRLCYLMMPLSVVLVKYFPAISRRYDAWTGLATNAGAMTSKNMLGAACVISGLFFFWDTVTRWSDRKKRRTSRIILVNLALLAMTLWLVNIANSATARLCLSLGCLVIAAAHSKALQRHPRFLRALLPAGCFLYLILAFGFNINAQVAGAVGRDPTLTDRTKIWSLLLSMQTNPLVGTGYESFWLGPRLSKIWQRFGLINEAHNGYLEVYLNLGIIGLMLLCTFLATSYRTISRRLKPFSNFASFTLALWTVLLFAAVSEAAMRGGLIWLTFLLGAIAIPGRAEDRVPSVAVCDNAETTDRFPFHHLQMTGQQR